VGDDRTAEHRDVGYGDVGYRDVGYRDTGPLEIRMAGFEDLPNTVLYDILRLRAEVFVVEQDCAFLDPDGRDHEPGARHMWASDGRGVVAALRLLDEGAGEWSVGRVVTRPDARRAGAASELVRRAVSVLLERGCRRVTADAQAHLAGWYGALGFVVAGPEHVEDGIPHVPMERRG
jgi:ElaA protein